MYAKGSIMLLAEIIKNILFQNSILFLICVGYTLIYSVTKTFQLISAIAFSISAYSFYYLTSQFDFSIVLSFSISISISTILCLTLDRLTLKKLRNENIQPLIGMILTLGLLIIFQNLFGIFFGNNLKLFRFKNTTLIKTTLILSSLIFLIYYGVINKTNSGRLFKAVSDNKNLAQIYGHKVESSIIIANILGFISASIAGNIVVCDTGIYPYTGFNFLIVGIVAMIISGLNNIIYTFLGTLFITCIQVGASYFINEQWANSLIYVVLILFLIIRPYGISGKNPKKTVI